MQHGNINKVIHTRCRPHLHYRSEPTNNCYHNSIYILTLQHPDI